MKLFRALLSAFILVASSVSASVAFAQTRELDATYKYISLKKDSFEFAKFLLTLDNGKIKIKAENESAEQIMDLKIEEGAHPEFTATLRSGVPAGVRLFRSELDLDGSGVKKKITIARQNQNQTTARLTIYVVENGHPFAIIKAYDSTQEAALNQAWEDVQ